MASLHVIVPLNWPAQKCITQQTIKIWQWEISNLLSLVLPCLSLLHPHCLTLISHDPLPCGRRQFNPPCFQIFLRTNPSHFSALLCINSKIIISPSTFGSTASRPLASLSLPIQSSLFSNIYAIQNILLGAALWRSRPIRMTRTIMLCLPVAPRLNFYQVTTGGMATALKVITWGDLMYVVI